MIEGRIPLSGERGDQKLLRIGINLCVISLVLPVLTILSFSIRFFLPETGIKVVGMPFPSNEPEILDYIKNDRYYVYAIPAYVPLFTILGFLNWFGLKLFRHSS